MRVIKRGDMKIGTRGNDRACPSWLYASVVRHVAHPRYCSTWVVPRGAEVTEEHAGHVDAYVGYESFVRQSAGGGGGGGIVDAPASEADAGVG
jgi:hypothetical protein